MRLLAVLIALLPLFAAAQSTTKSTNAVVNKDDAAPTNPANEIPIFIPNKATQPDDALKLDPLARVMPFPTTEDVPVSTSPPTTTPAVSFENTAKPKFRSPSPSPSSTPARSPSQTVSIVLPGPTKPVDGACSGAACDRPERSYNFTDFPACAVAQTHGPVAVSVAGKGTFCAFPPVCSGSVRGNCPGIQTGLDFSATCELLPGGAYGCVGH